MSSKPTAITTVRLTLADQSDRLEVRRDREEDVTWRVIYDGEVEAVEPGGEAADRDWRVMEPTVGRYLCLSLQGSGLRQPSIRDEHLLAVALCTSASSLQFSV